VLKQIVVPVDESEGATRAVEFAARIAQSMGAEILILHICTPSPVSAMAPVPRSREELSSVAARQSEASFEMAKKKLAGLAPVTVRYRTEVGDPAERVLDVVEQTSADLVVLGHEVRSLLTRLFVGSVAHRLVDEASVPVVIVP